MDVLINAPYRDLLIQNVDARFVDQLTNALLVDRDYTDHAFIEPDPTVRSPLRIELVRSPVIRSVREQEALEETRKILKEQTEIRRQQEAKGVTI